MQKQTWKELAAIQIGGVICLPTIMIGQTLCQSYGYSAAAASIILGNLVLLLFGLAGSHMSCQTGKTTVENAGDYLSGRGVILFAGVMLVSMLGWFAIQLNLMSLSVLDLLGIQTGNSLALIASNGALGLMITLVAGRGVKALAILSKISLPLMVMTLGYALYSVEGSLESSNHQVSLKGTSLVIAAALAMIIDMPTFFRHAKNSRDGLLASVIIFGIALPMIELLGVYLAAYSSHSSLIGLLKGNDGTLWGLWIGLFLILAGWTTNNTNLYSSIISTEFLAPRAPRFIKTWGVGIAGTALACLDLVNRLELTLDILGIMIGSLGSVILARYLTDLTGIGGGKSKDGSAPKKGENMLLWGIGVVLGLMSLWNLLPLTSIPVLDACLVAILVPISTMTQRGKYEKAYN